MMGDINSIRSSEAASRTISSRCPRLERAWKRYAFFGFKWRLPCDLLRQTRGRCARPARLPQENTTGRLGEGGVGGPGARPARLPQENTSHAEEGSENREDTI